MCNLLPNEEDERWIHTNYDDLRDEEYNAYRHDYAVYGASMNKITKKYVITVMAIGALIGSLTGFTIGSIFSGITNSDIDDINTWIIWTPFIGAGVGITFALLFCYILSIKIRKNIYPFGSAIGLTTGLLCSLFVVIRNIVH